MGFNMIAIYDDSSGRFAIQDDKAGRSVWIDDDAMKERVTKSIEAKKDRKITSTVFMLQRNIIEQVGMQLPHDSCHNRIGVFTYLEFRCLKQFIDIDYGGDGLAEEWPRRSWNNCRAKWQVLFSRPGGPPEHVHWLRSEESWVQAQKA